MVSPKKTTLLIVDDQQEILNSLQRLFKLHYHVLTAASGQEALEILQEQEIAVILSDQRMPGMDGVSFLRAAMELQPEAVRLLITGYADIEATVDAVNEAKIYQYISKPFEPDDLKKIVDNAAERFRLMRHNSELQKRLAEQNRRLADENATLHAQMEQQLDLGNLIANSPPMLQVFKLVKKVMNTPTTVLLLGETGTGKEMLAKLIHYNSNKKDKMFVVQNCGAIPDTLLQSELFGHKKGSFTGAVADKKGLFEAAHGGTIFLDEIGDTSPALQLGLLRVLQEGEVLPVGATRSRKIDVRVIAATNKNLQEEVKAGRFREDLFYRLSVFPIELPPLHRRREDIPDLVRHFIDKYAGRIGKRIPGISPAALRILMASQFPGNIRELENEIERMVTLAEDGLELNTELLSPRFLDTATELPVQFEPGTSLKKSIASMEQSMIQQALQLTRGNILRAAAELQISRVGLHKMLKRYEIDPGLYKPKKR